MARTRNPVPAEIVAVDAPRRRRRVCLSGTRDAAHVTQCVQHYYARIPSIPEQDRSTRVPSGVAAAFHVWYVLLAGVLEATNA